MSFWERHVSATAWLVFLGWWGIGILALVLKGEVAMYVTLTGTAVAVIAYAFGKEAGYKKRRDEEWEEYQRKLEERGA